MKQLSLFEHENLNDNGFPEKLFTITEIRKIVEDLEKKNYVGGFFMLTPLVCMNSVSAYSLLRELEKYEVTN